MERFLTKIIPEMFDRIELWRIRRQIQQLQIAWQDDALTAMPACAINHHEDVFFQVAACNLIRKHLHTGAIHTGQYQGVEHTIHR
jgi:hypothetical protein